MPDKPYDPGDDLLILVSRVECAVCGEPILGLGPEDRPHLFKVDRIKDPRTREPMALYCHQRICKETINEVNRHGDWKKLPPGPLRKAFAEAIRQAKERNSKFYV